MSERPSGEGGLQKLERDAKANQDMKAMYKTKIE